VCGELLGLVFCCLLGFFCLFFFSLVWFLSFLSEQRPPPPLFERGGRSYPSFEDPTALGLLFFFLCEYVFLLRVDIAALPPIDGFFRSPQMMIDP